MQDTKLQTAMTIGTALSALEQSIEATMLRQGELLRILLEARPAEGFAFTVGQGVIARVAGAGARMADVRGDIVEAHKLLDSLAKFRGYPVIAEGDKEEGPSRVVTGEAMPLRAAA